MSRWYKRNESVETMEVDQEWMILHPEKYTVTKLNEVGGLCWSLLKDNQTIDTLTQELLKEYVVEEEKIRQDVLKFFDELFQLGLIEYAS